MKFTTRWLGRAPYDEVHELQKELLAKRIAREIENTLLLVEHEAVVTAGKGVTIGKGGHIENVPGGAESLRARGIAFAETGRGGDVTYHGPGQLVAYPIFDLRPDRCDVRRYVGDLSRVMIALCKDYGVDAGTIPGDSKYVGVWVDRDSPKKWAEIDASDAAFPGRRLAKIGAIGVRLSHWVTMHGFAFNVRPNLAHFEAIVPCGIREYGVTSLEDLDVDAPSVEKIGARAAQHFTEIFCSA